MSMEKFNMAEFLVNLSIKFLIILRLFTERT